MSVYMKCFVQHCHGHRLLVVEINSTVLLLLLQTLFLPVEASSVSEMLFLICVVGIQAGGDTVGALLEKDMTWALPGMEHVNQVC